MQPRKDQLKFFSDHKDLSIRGVSIITVTGITQLIKTNI